MADPTSAPDIEGSDAVGFTAGIEGAPFGAGVVHAYLAADRKPPVLVAGISLGAINAAAMQRVYLEMHGAKGSAKEARRWRWFRRYLGEIARNPLSVFWDAIPDQSDFFTNRPPIQDPATPPSLAKMEIEARRQRFLLTRLGKWLSDCRVKVKDVASLIVHFIRYTERHRGWRRFGLSSLLKAWLIVDQLVRQAVAHPSWIREQDFTWDATVIDQAFETRPQKSFPRPLFGWTVWLTALLIVVSPYAALGCAAAFFLAVVYGEEGMLLPLAVLSVALFVTHVLLMLRLTGFLGRFWGWVRTTARAVKKIFGGKIRPVEPGGSWIIRRTLANLGIDRSLIHPFSIRRAMQDLFGREKINSRREGAPHLLVVAAPLQVLFKVRNLPAVIPWRKRLTAAFRGTGERITSWLESFKLDPRAKLKKFLSPSFWVSAAKLLKNRLTHSTQEREAGKPEVAAQLWASGDCEIDEALQAAVSTPPFLPPLHVPRKKCRQWLGVKKPGDHAWSIAETDLDLVDGSVIRHNPLPAMFTFLRHDGGDVSRRLARGTKERPSVHVVYAVPSEDRENASGLKDSQMNIVDVALLSRRLASRRDTGLEVEQTNFITALETEIDAARPERVIAHAGEIAPEQDIVYRNPVKPSTQEILASVAAGCRRTLERLYFDDPAAGETGEVACGAFLRSKWHDRPQNAQVGLNEVCGNCTGVLNLRRTRKAPPRIEVHPTAVLNRPDVAARPRVVFVTSGGVFRGSFHIGMLGALKICDVRPDLIVGASVGTLMGAALGKMLQSQEVLHDLVDLFASVDQRIALTRTFKAAVRQLGVRGESIDLSPAELKEAVKRGSRGDAGYAATGAPPALIDALSTLFLLPHRHTRDIAARFVAGHVSEAVGRFLGALRAETLWRLGVEKYLIGSSLLEAELRRLLGMTDDSFEFQPFRDHLDFYATATNLATESMVVLGSATPQATQAYDFVKAALASSAFPVVFSPVRESDVYPGIGRPDIHYGDGGMFDNLPFLPAINLLASAQKKQKWEDPIVELKRRYATPDLMIVGALNVNPEERVGRESRFTTIVSIKGRADELQENVKIRGFQKSAERVDDQIGRFIARGDEYLKTRNPDFLNGIVNAAVLPVFPSSEAHLNKTFAFSTTTGLSRDVIHRSIGDGCFRTLQVIADHQSPSRADSLTKKALHGIGDRLRRLTYATKDHARHQCPFFSDEDGNPISCPFVFRDQKGKIADDVYDKCRHDAAHVAAYKHGRRATAAHGQ